MTLYDYRISRELGKRDPPFAALIMAALRKADTENAAKLRSAWPAVCDETQARLRSPGGVLASDANPG